MSPLSRRLQAVTATLTPASGITHGRQVFATNTGIAGIGLTRSQLTPSGSITVSTPGAVVSNMLVSGTLTVAADNVTISGCQVENSGSAAFCIVVQASNCTIQNCTVVPPGVAGSASAYMGVVAQIGGGLIIRSCDISYCENNVSLNNDGGSTLIETSFLHDASNVLNPLGHRDCIEVYAGVNVNIRKNKLLHPTGETSVVNIAPWSGNASVITCNVDDNYIDGGHMHFVDDLQSTGVIQNVRVRRNDMGGHTTPNVGGIYWGLNSKQPITQTEAGLTSNPNQVLWPFTGPDVNYWVNCASLTPNRTGMIINDPTTPIFQP